MKKKTNIKFAFWGDTAKQQEKMDEIVHRVNRLNVLLFA